ncbi:Nonribosomal peptide synthetases (NRPS) [Penicillium verhagenii]|uniref:Nonribosomal peptide synthetases (NRPS) n=1 Tax=Penicillium verhagenii TaxID=1562060 RepID=UPI002544F5B4|nr:Nonribosomal peptide synthetases (NRPS) [Penicillium verhagenii]KAJ5917371.1 Nonribosomal peptide synthetases (NRPS) [Penicillium verhagenii]
MGNQVQFYPGRAETWDREFEAPSGNLSFLLSQAAARYHDHEVILSLHQPKIPSYFNEAKSEGPCNLRLTYQQLHLASLRFARALSSRGVTRNSSVVTFLFNQFEWCLAFWASMHLGCRFVPLDPRTISQPEEALYLLKQANAGAVLVATDALAAQVEEILPKGHEQDIFRCLLSDESTEQLPDGWALVSDVMSSSPDDIDLSPGFNASPQDSAVLLFSSGTTSRPKACPQTSLNLSAPAVQLGQTFHIAPGHTICQHLPSFHIFGIAFSLAGWLAGATVVFPSPSFDAASSIQAILQGTNVHAPCVPMMVQAIAEHPSSPTTGFSTLSSITLGGAPSFPRIIETCKALTPKRLCVGYGLTEGVVTLMNVKDINAWQHTGDISSGRVCSGSRIKICEPGKRVAIGYGQLGELHQGGVPVFNGYLGMDSDACYQEDGVNWVATGDQAYMDEGGYVYIPGRYKDIIIRGGENISPAKIENCLRKAKGVNFNQAYVIGIPDDLAGEVPIAVVQQAGPSVLSGNELKAMALSELTPGFAPARVLDVQRDLGRDTFPTTTTGKVQKLVLRRWVMEYLDSLASLPVIDDSCQSLESQLTSIWVHFSGQKLSEVDFDESFHKIADSMTLIQLTGQIRKTLHRSVSMTDLVENNTLRKLMGYLARKPLLANNPAPPRSLPWDSSMASNMMHIKGHTEHMQVTRNQAVGHLTPLGFGWDDMEDLLPLSDCMKLMTRGGRSQSWNHRHSLVVRSVSTAEVEATIKLWIKRNPMLRATHMACGNDSQLYVIMRPNDRWLDTQITTGSSLASIDDIPTYRLNDSTYDHVQLSGPLLKCTVLPIDNCKATGVVLHMHHVMFDGMVMHRWYQDLNQLLQGKMPPSLCAFREFASFYQAYRESREAQEAVDYHVNQLRGLGAIQKDFWPQQRAPRWFKGDDHGWCHEDGSQSHPGERVLLDGDRSCGTMGFFYKIHLPFIRALKSKWELSPPIVAKSACALLNIYKTGADEAVFVSDESGRAWPSMEENSTSVPPTVSPLDIGGPTFQKTINRIRVEPNETTLQFLQRMQKKQQDIDRYCHAPLDAIISSLEQDSVHGLADAAAVRDILQRQLFDWLPSPPSSENVDGEPAAPVEMLEVLSRSDLGLVWFPSLLPGDYLLLEVSWDDAQLRGHEIYQAIQEFLCALVWISNPENFDKPVTQCEFQGQKALAASECNFHR